MKSFLIRLLIYTTFVFFLIGIYIFSQPYLIKKMPNDSRRDSFVIEHLNDVSFQPETIVFGDSRTMFGVNAKELSSHLTKKNEVVNLATLGQSLKETGYYFGHISPNTKTIIQCVEFGVFQQKSKILDSKAISLITRGLTIEDETHKILPDVHPYFDRSTLSNYYEARTFVKGSIHTFVRGILDDEKFNDEKFSDLYHPYIYQADKHPNYPFYQKCFYDSLHVLPENAILVNRYNEYFGNKDIEYYFVLMPLNSDICVLEETNKSQYLSALYKNIPNVKVLDLSDALPAEYFYDGIHSNATGASILSTSIANFINHSRQKNN